MASFFEDNWEVILTSFGISTGLIAIGSYIWSRFILWVERNDLKSQKSRVETIKELIELRNEFSNENKSEEILVHTILRTATTKEILRLTNLINRKNSGILYYLQQAALIVIGGPIIIFLSINCAINMINGDIWTAISIFIGNIFLTTVIVALYGALYTRKGNSSRLIASTILEANSKEDVDSIIIKALQGTKILTTEKDS